MYDEYSNIFAPLKDKSFATLKKINFIEIITGFEQ